LGNKCSLITKTVLDEHINDIPINHLQNTHTFNKSER